MSEGTAGTEPAAPVAKQPSVQDALRLVERLAQLMLEGAKLHDGAEDAVRAELRELRDEAAALRP